MKETIKSEFSKQPLSTACAVAAALGIWIALAIVLPYVVLAVAVLVGVILWKESKPQPICTKCDVS